MCFKLINSKYSSFLIWNCIPAQQWLEIWNIQNYFSMAPANFTEKKHLNSTLCTSEISKLWKNAGDLEHAASFNSKSCVRHNPSQLYENTNTV
jgi:hypothetical protein